MGLSSIVAMHDPIRDPDGSLVLLGTRKPSDLFPNADVLTLRSGWEEDLSMWLAEYEASMWPKEDGFAFVVSSQQQKRI